MNYVLLLLIFISQSSFGHEGKVHGHKAKAVTQEQVPEDVLKSINESYVKDVKPIFQKSCFNCHSSSTTYPWYASLPLAKQLIKSDITEAKEHLEMSHDFPFGGHGNPKEDLEAISKSVKEGSMPPLRYRIMHPGSAVNEADQLTIQTWVSQSLENLSRR
ncbi:MAG TPA: heme-binding domain-containing protein [Bdellovibrionales bacterium]|nr:heme-binding domain-containing protein [Bdellovibrionales bacterium]